MDEKPKRTYASMPGQNSLFRGKVRKPVTLTLTPAHHELIGKAQARLGLTRADVIALLIELYAATVKIPLKLFRARERSAKE